MSDSAVENMSIEEGACDEALGSDSRIRLDEGQLSIHERVSTRAIDEMEKMRSMTEKAVLNIGNSLNEVVEIATSSNREIADSLSGFVGGESNAAETAQQTGSVTIVETIDRQSQMISDLVEMIKQCFEKQLRLTRSATSVCTEIYESAIETEQLMARSKMIALNMHIEAKRIGGQEGASFGVLANEMNRFSSDVAINNKTIANAIKVFAADMPKLEEETVSLNNKLMEFSGNFNREMEDVQYETANLSNLLKRIHENAKTRNGEIVDFSHAMLSELQFQDPVSQGLLRAVHDLKLVSQIVNGEHIDETSLADIADDVGHEAGEEFESGELLMF